MLSGLPRIARFGRFELNLDNGDLLREGKPVRMQPRAAKLLTLLVGRAGDIVAREEIHKHLWNGTVVDYDQGVNNSIREIRDALGDNAASPVFLDTVPRRGYRFIAPVELGEGSEVKSGGMPPSVLVGIILAVAALALAIASALWTLSPDQLSEEDSDFVTIIVLPFTSTEGESVDGDVAGDTVTTDLIESLARLSPRTLRVIARDSTMALRGNPRGPLAIGKSFEVDYVLSGTIEREGESLRGVAKLFDTDRGKLIWTSDVSDENGDLSFLSIALRQRVAEALAPHVPDIGRRRLFPPSTPSTREARDAWVKGRYLELQHRPAAALEQYSLVTDLDPEFAPAYVGVAYSIMSLPDAANRIGAAKSALRRALEIDDSLSDAWVHLGNIALYYDWNWATANESFQRALSLQPGSPAARSSLAAYYSSLGRHEEAISQVRQALELDPISPIVQGDVGLVYYWARRYDDALHQYEELLALDPDNTFGQLGTIDCLLLTGKDTEALDHAVVLMRSLHAEPDEIRGVSEGETGERVRRYLEWVRHRYELQKNHGIPVAGVMAILEIRLGNVSGALDWLDQAFRERAPIVAFLAVEPMFDSVRDQPRFQRMLERVGLATNPPADLLDTE